MAVVACRAYRGLIRCESRFGPAPGVRRARRDRADRVHAAGRISQSALIPRHHRDSQGILMQRERLTDEQAFNLLVSTSQKANIKIHDLAVWLVDNVNNAASRPD